MYVCTTLAYYHSYYERLNRFTTDSLALHVRWLKLDLVAFCNAIHDNTDVGESLFDIVDPSVIGLHTAVSVYF